MSATISDGPPDAGRVDGGTHGAAFLVRPSQRTKAMVDAANRARHDKLPRLLKVDPGGVARALESYQSVGLKLFPRPKRFRRADALQERFFTMVGIMIVLVGVLGASEHVKRTCGATTLPAVGRCLLGRWWVFS